MIDRYLKHFEQNALKISHALQVMSSIVAAAVDTHGTAGKEKFFKEISYVNSLSCNSDLNSHLLFTTVCQCL